MITLAGFEDVELVFLFQASNFQRQVCDFASTQDGQKKHIDFLSTDVKDNESSSSVSRHF